MAERPQLAALQACSVLEPDSTGGEVAPTALLMQFVWTQSPRLIC